MNHKRTKIICTIGPATESFSTLKKLHKAGMNVARLNMSHSDHRTAKKVISRIKKLNSQIQNPVGILLDTQGPEIRTGDTSSIVHLDPGQLVSFTIRDESDVETTSIRVHYDELIQSVKVGTLISLDNGLLNFKVLKKTKNELECIVLDGGKLGSKRHVNLPGIRVNLPSVTEKDKKDILFGLNEGVDFIALSFVRNASDIEDLKKLLKKRVTRIKIISKIEDREGLSNIDEICKVSDGVMVARGDLGIETDLSNLPNVQRKIMSTCAKNGVRSIVATHLLESMIENPTPTRAEVTDVANAMYEGSDAVMLSGETTIGKYPVECVSLITRIAKQTEKYRTLGYESKLIVNTDWQHLGVAAKSIAESINADGIIAITRSGQTAEIVSNAKPFMIPVFAFSSNKNTLKQLSLAGSVNAFYSAMHHDHEKNINSVMKVLKKTLLPKEDLKFVVISGILSEKTADAIEIRHLTVK
ncbi:MAG TPA: pyruvate kinase [SAR86 cluster bacterium]|nr:pyruvate kinase [SAR86 cluster bacterium]|tara:strand:- start:11492 stop:12904 length:1413 start_codon:yes stop_codon:yes gene_type:complete